MVMRKNKYLEDIGLKRKEYGTNFAWDIKHAAQWRKERKQYGFDSRETWNLDRTFVEWLYSHLMMYQECTTHDLDFNKIVFADNEYTLGEAVEVIVNACREYLIRYDDMEMEEQESLAENVKQATRLFAEVFVYLWW
jgi:hypothetical protein